MNRRKKIKGLKLDVYSPPGVMPDIMREYSPWWRSAHNIEDGDPVTSENIEGALRQVEKRITKLTNKIRAKKLIE